MPMQTILPTCHTHHATLSAGARSWGRGRSRRWLGAHAVDGRQELDRLGDTVLAGLDDLHRTQEVTTATRCRCGRRKGRRGAHRGGGAQTNVAHLRQRERVRRDIRRRQIDNLAAAAVFAVRSREAFVWADGGAGARVELDAAVGGAPDLELHDAHAAGAGAGQAFVAAELKSRSAGLT